MLIFILQYIPHSENSFIFNLDHKHINSKDSHSASQQCLAPVAAYLRLQNILVFPYINHCLLVAHFRHKAQKDTHFVLALHNLDLAVNEQKSNLKPAKIVHYIGALTDFAQACAFLPTDKRQNVITLLQGFTPHAMIPALTVQRVLGTMASRTSAVQHVGLKMRSLQSWFLALSILLTLS